MGLGPFSDPLWRKSQFHRMDAGPLYLMRTGELEEWLTSGAGVTTILRGNQIQVNISGAAGRTRWKKMEPPRYLYRHDAWGGDEQTFRLPWDIEVFMCCTQHLNTTPPGVNVDGSIMAFGIGSNNNNPTYPIGQTPNHPLIMLYNRLDTFAWELLIQGVADSFTPNTIVPLVGVEPMVLSKGSHARLIFNPTGGPANGPICRAFIDGKLGAEVTDPAVLPGNVSLGTIQAHMGYFELAANGTNAAGNITCQYGPVSIDNRGWITAP